MTEIYQICKISLKRRSLNLKTKKEKEELARYLWKVINKYNLRKYLNPKGNLGGSSLNTVKKQIHEETREIQKIL
ncbi:MAG: hypothetical protein ACOZBL_04870, partial [Patescibacteria group bacterium]